MIISIPTSQYPLLPSQSYSNNRSSISPTPSQLKRSLTTASSTRTSVAAKHVSSSPSSFYEILGVPMGATSDEVKSAFRKLARVCHPDVAAKDAPTDEFIKIHTAYSTLSDPTKRANYDRQMFRRHRSFTVLSASASSLSPSPAYTRRNWETDQCW